MPVLNEKDKAWIRDVAQKCPQSSHVLEVFWPARFGHTVRPREFEEILWLSKVRDVGIRNGRLYLIESNKWRKDSDSPQAAASSDSWNSGSAKPDKKLAPLRRVEAMSLLEGRVRKRHLVLGLKTILCRKCRALPLENQVVVLPCKHIYCEDCYNLIVHNSADTPRCIECNKLFETEHAQVLSRRSEVSADWITAASEIIDLLEHLRITCPFRKSRHGCKWEGEVCEALSHVMKCNDAAIASRSSSPCETDDDESSDDDSTRRGARLRLGAQLEKRLNHLFRAAGLKPDPKRPDPAAAQSKAVPNDVPVEVPPLNKTDWNFMRSQSEDWTAADTDLMTLPQLGRWSVVLAFNAQRDCPPNLPLLPYAWLDVRVGDIVIVHAHPANNVWGFALGMREDRPDLKGWFPWGCILPTDWSLSRFMTKLTELKFNDPIKYLEDAPLSIPCISTTTAAPPVIDDIPSSSEEGSWEPMPPPRKQVIEISD